MVMLISFLLQQQDQEEVPDEEAEDSQRRDDPVPEMEVEVVRSPVPDMSPPSPPPPPSATALAEFCIFATHKNFAKLAKFR